MSPRAHALALACSALMIWVALNLAAGVFARDVRFDLSADRFASLSPPVETALGALAEPVMLTLTFSRDAARDHPELEAHGLRVREYLRQLAARSHGMVRLVERDPRPGGPAEAAAVALGLTPMGHTPRGPVYLALSGVNAVDERHMAAALTPERAALLERDVVDLLAKLERAHIAANAARGVPERATPDRRLAFARAPAEQRSAQKESLQRLILIVHAVLAPLLLIGAGVFVRRRRARLGERPAP